MGSLQMAASQDKQALLGHWEEKEKGHPTILLAIDGAPPVYTHTDPHLSPSVAGCLPLLAYTGCFPAFLPPPQSH